MRANPLEVLNNNRFTVLWSGGKDSTAALLWVLDNVRHDNFNVLYIEVTGNTHPLCTEYVKEVAELLGIKDKLIVGKREDLDFFDCIRRWGVPLIGKYRWCLYQFKLKVMERYSYPIQVSGVRRGDSWRRRRVRPVDFFKISMNVVVNPILEWSSEDVLNYIRKHGIPVNPCYRIYGHSANCMLCPYHDKRAIALTLRDPYWREKILNALRHVKAPFSRKIAKKWFSLAKTVPLETFLR